MQLRYNRPIWKNQRKPKFFLRWEKYLKLREGRSSRGLIGEVAQWKQAKDIRAYVAAVKSASPQGSAELETTDREKWISWALSHADRIDPLKNGNLGKGVDSDRDLKDRPDWG